MSSVTVNVACPLEFVLVLGDTVENEPTLGVSVTVFPTTGSPPASRSVTVNVDADVPSAGTVPGLACSEDWVASAVAGGGGGGGEDAASSTAPMSQCAPCGRAVPRWSRAGQAASNPASTAGLDAAGRSVSVDPPLFWSAPSCGSAVTTPPVTVPHVVSVVRSLRLCESSVPPLLHSPPPAAGVSKIVLSASTSAPP